MAIGRISGPMLFANLERQGLDLAIDGNLIYFDVNRKRIGVNQSSPEYTVHIDGFEGESATLFVNGNITSYSLAVADAYTLPTFSGNAGDVLTSNGAQGTYWSAVVNQVNRKKFNYEIENLPAGETHEFEIDIGFASIVYALTVNRPVLVEVFATPTKDETNPYTFLATFDHLTDDGTVLLDDGTIIQQRQYSIFANQEEPPQPKTYCTITNIDGVDGNVSLKLTYFAAVTDNTAMAYNVNVVDTLPTTGITGQSVMLKTDKKIYVWFDGQWNASS